MDIVRERLEREFGAEPHHHRARRLFIASITHCWRDADDRQSGEAAATNREIERIEEPVIQATLHLPQEYLGGVLKLCEEKRGTAKRNSLSRSQAGHAHLRVAAQRRSWSIFTTGLNRSAAAMRRWITKSTGYRAGGSGQARRAHQRRYRGCHVDDRAPGKRLLPGPRAGADDARADPAPDVRGRDPSGDRQPDHLARDRSRRYAKTSPPNVTAAISRASANCWSGRKRGKKRMKQVGKVEIPQEAFLAALKV